MLLLLLPPPADAAAGVLHAVAVALSVALAAGL